MILTDGQSWDAIAIVSKNNIKLVSEKIYYQRGIIAMNKMYLDISFNCTKWEMHFFYSQFSKILYSTILTPPKSEKQ